VEGGGRRLWSRPGRVFAAARWHTFAGLADAIDTAFARWDRAHLCLFEFVDGADVCGPFEWEDPPDGSLFAGATRLSRLSAGEQFLYTFDMGDDWTHLCIIAEQRTTRWRSWGSCPTGRCPTGAGGEIPDQYGRRSEDDDGQAPLAADRISPIFRRCARTGARAEADGCFATG
jgi:hypothetical protein